MEKTSFVIKEVFFSPFLFLPQSIRKIIFPQKYGMHFKTLYLGRDSKEDQFVAYEDII